MPELGDWYDRPIQADCLVDTTYCLGWEQRIGDSVAAYSGASDASSNGSNSMNSGRLAMGSGASGGWAQSMRTYPSGFQTHQLDTYVHVTRLGVAYRYASIPKSEWPALAVGYMDDPDDRGEPSGSYKVVFKAPSGQVTGGNINNPATASQTAVDHDNAAPEASGLGPVAGVVVSDVSIAAFAMSEHGGTHEFGVTYTDVDSGQLNAFGGLLLGFGKRTFRPSAWNLSWGDGAVKDIAQGTTLFGPWSTQIYTPSPPTFGAPRYSESWTALNASVANETVVTYPGSTEYVGIATRHGGGWGGNYQSPTGSHPDNFQYTCSVGCSLGEYNLVYRDFRPPRVRWIYGTGPEWGTSAKDAGLWLRWTG